MEILENQTLEMKNVLSYRAKMTQQEMALKMQEIERIMKENNAQKTGPAASSTFAMEQSASGPIVDMEILIPLDKEVPLPDGFVWKPRFLLTNAVKLCHVGHPAQLQNSVNELNTYIAEHCLTPITSGYNVTVKEAKTPLEFDAMEIHIYVGVSPNLL